MSVLTLRSKAMERKIISVSGKRQITIPQKFFNMLHLDNEVECTVENNALIIRPLKNDTSEFAEQILDDLISQGYSGKELSKKFKEENKRIYNAARAMIADANKIATGEIKAATYKDIFGEN